MGASSSTAEGRKRLVADLQARAIRGKRSRGEATIGTVVEEALALYANHHGLAAVQPPQGRAKKS